GDRRPSASADGERRKSRAAGKSASVPAPVPHRHVPETAGTDHGRSQVPAGRDPSTAGGITAPPAAFPPPPPPILCSHCAKSQCHTLLIAVEIGSYLYLLSRL